jgi:twinkle protein
MTTLSADIKETLAARGINSEVAAKLGLHSLPVKGGGECLVIPFIQDGAVVNKKYRTFGDKKRFWQDSGGKKCFWNEDVLRDDALLSLPLIITEGEMDAIAAIQAGFQRCVSVPEGAPPKSVERMDSAKYSFLDTARPLITLDRAKEIILAVDGDGPGAALLQDLSVRLGRFRCKWVKYPKHPDGSGSRLKDLNEVLQHFGPKGVVETINRARWLRVDGVYAMSDLPPIPETVAYDIGFPKLRENYRMRLGDLCVVTGIPSMGKSTFVNDLCCRATMNNGLHVAFASFEQSPQGDHRRNLRTWMLGKPVSLATPVAISDTDHWIDQRFTFLVPSEDDDVTLDWMLDRMEAAVVQRGANVIVIDPWNEMDHTRNKDETTTEYTGRAIKALKRFAKKFMVHLIIVAHPSKQQKDLTGEHKIPTLYDISDSSHWYNKSDIGVIVHRNKDGDTIIRVAKSRYHDEIGRPGDQMAVFHSGQRRYEIV